MVKVMSRVETLRGMGRCRGVSVQRRRFVKIGSASCASSGLIVHGGVFVFTDWIPFHAAAFDAQQHGERLDREVQPRQFAEAGRRSWFHCCRGRGILKL